MTIHTFLQNQPASLYKLELLYQRKPQLPQEVVTSPHEEIDETQQTTEATAGYAPELYHHMEEMMK